MEITIYATHRGAARDAPEQTYYSLERPELACSGFINVSEYELPAGYAIARSFEGLKLLNSAGKACQLGGGRRPLLIDPDTIDQGKAVALEKTRDITMAVIMGELLEEEGYADHHA